MKSNHCESFIFLSQHIFGHHPYTNIEGVDPDISTAQEVSICELYNFTQGRSQDFSKGGHTVSNIIVMAFSPRNIVGCFLKKKTYKGGVTGTPGPPSLRP